MKVIDIGCGRKKIPGSIGIDFSDYADVDIKLDLNTSKLPFKDNSIDFVHTSHCLEHLSHVGFLNMIGEMYRVCKSAGTIFIAVPYFQQSANLANPFHNNNICFNEHTFRFFSSDQDCPPALVPQDYISPSCPQWGLRYSAVDEIAIELKLEKLEYLYFKEYENCDEDYLRDCRKRYLGVVESIHYWLKPIKPAPTYFDNTTMEKQTAEDIIKFINGQQEYLKNQIDWLQNLKDKNFSNSHPVEKLKNKNVGSYLDEILIPNAVLLNSNSALYTLEGMICPYHEVVRNYDKTIQSIRVCIDDINDNL
ncbi:methyltransferase domain-containing protein [Ahrensia sp. 13_GOM-1096m]|uniref:class I SAM-dependent methyltransferase n=1 Tax=Ahrensia sp. 13_GOM-1096m TaxID=1380380 RepID=UPI0006877DE3|nr:methyltransferase domain-containing protein [Ahrensia sp. 13_GOM-1096m]